VCTTTMCDGARRQPRQQCGSCATDVQDAHDLGALIDREEHAVDVRAATVVEESNRAIRVEAVRCYSAPSPGVSCVDRSFLTLLESRYCITLPVFVADPASRSKVGRADRWPHS